MAQRALSRSDPRTAALRDTVADLLALDQARLTVAGMISGLDIRYQHEADDHPCVGRRVPDLELATPTGTTRIYEQLHDANALYIDLSSGSRPAVDLGPASKQVKSIAAACSEPWELPIVGQVETPSAVLVRPDGHVAWAGDAPDDALNRALTRWFGATNPE